VASSQTIDRVMMIELSDRGCLPLASWCQQRVRSAISSRTSWNDERFALPEAGPGRRFSAGASSCCMQRWTRSAAGGPDLTGARQHPRGSPNQLTGRRTVKFATGMDLATRIVEVQWIGCPAADFVYVAKW